MLAIRSKWLLAAGLASVMAVGCGHSDEEMAAKQREIDKLSADMKAAKDQLTADQARYTEAQSQIEAMKSQLQDFAKTKEDKENLLKALKDYKERADRLAVIEARFRELRTKLDKLNAIGLKVVVRNNRMVIQLPGDILFDSGKDALKPQGKEALGQVAEIIRGDKDLTQRYFVVAGHTDNAKYGGGPFNDNWGLSLARSRQVLLFMINPVGKKAGEGGGLDAVRWSAAGYGDTDPQEGNIATQSKDQMQKNRRVELVVQPNVEEMLQLNSITGSDAQPKPASSDPRPSALPQLTAAARAQRDACVGKCEKDSERKCAGLPDTGLVGQRSLCLSDALKGCCGPCGSSVNANNHSMCSH